MKNSILKTVAGVHFAPPSFIDAAIAESGIAATYRHDYPAIWAETLSKAIYLPVSYSDTAIDYQHACQRGYGGDWWEISLILQYNNQPCALWPLSYSVKDDKRLVSTYGLPVLPPLFVRECPVKTRKALTKVCMDIVESICRLAGIMAWESAESFNGMIGLSDWHKESMRRGASAALRHELFVDLAPELPAIKSHFRKSYKALITSGGRLWRVGVLESENQAIWDEFRLLHLKVSGRVTRSDETWAILHKSIARGDAFMVFLRDDDGEMIGGGFFRITRDEGSYGIGAYDRTLFDKPLGHVVQFRAIEEMKKRGLRWHKLGLRPHSSELPSPTEKELTIGKFKQGFASHLFPKYLLLHEIKT